MVRAASIDVNNNPPANLIELNKLKNLIQILDMMGRETTFKSNTLVYVYDDGSTEGV